MEKEFVEKMKASLLEQKKELVQQLMESNEEFKQIVETMDSKDEVDIASDNIDGSQLVALNSKIADKVKLIDNTLLRIEQGKYGYCVRCGKQIPTERLEAIPYALMCIECKSSDERRIH